MVVIPADIRFDVASLLACGVITGFGAVTNTAGLKPGQSAVVIGCGGVGLNAIQGAAIAGADPLIAVDLFDDKIAAARRFGATHGFNPKKTDAASAVMALTQGRGADFVFVATGSKAAFDSAPDFITKCGTIVVVGMPANGVTATYDPSTLAAWNQRILGSKMGDARIATDIPTLVGHYRSGRLRLDELITGRYPLSAINEAIAEVNAGTALRNVIIFD
jgi:S-(hydroxymethyl)glutathione dehydrogenase/alcohol dehydrogenase